VHFLHILPLTEKPIRCNPAAALFLWFLERNGILFVTSGERLISDAALVAMTLMIAESRPEEKDVLVRIVTHLLCDRAGHDK